MTAKIIDGKAYAEELRARIADHVRRLQSEHGITPGLAVVIVGKDPASQVYVSNKAKQTAEVRMLSNASSPPTSAAELLELVGRLNKSDRCVSLCSAAARSTSTRTR
jgi:methylenetetrahydrofolate dehydrogenase (NADP+)/methenyltetrahydrofolate cyclohydrolase